MRRERLFDLLAKPLHPEIFNKKPVTAVMEIADAARSTVSCAWSR